MLNLNSIMIGSHQPKVLIEFYEKILDKKPDMGEEDWAGWQVESAFLGIGPHSEISGSSKEPARIMFNFETNDVDGEFERIKDLGAEVVKEPYEPAHGMKMATFADPDGNYFQLATPWEEQK